MNSSFQVRFLLLSRLAKGATLVGVIALVIASFAITAITKSRIRKVLIIAGIAVGTARIASGIDHYY